MSIMNTKYTTWIYIAIWELEIKKELVPPARLIPEKNTGINCPVDENNQSPCPPCADPPNKISFPFS